MSSPKNEKPLNDQLRELDELITWFDQDDFDLDEALKKFDEGIALTEKIETRLSALENKITILRKRFGENGAGK